MKDFLIELKSQREIVESIVDRIENGQLYLEELKAYLPKLNQIFTKLFQIIDNEKIELNQTFVLQVLNDIIYGIEQKDSVFLEDVLRYGLIEIYDYIGMELQREDYHE